MARKRLIGRKRPDRQETIEAFWSGRYAQAQTPQAVAAVEYDRLRVEVARLPPRDAERLWREVATQLARWREQAGERVTRRDVHE